jgi:hypothetical protein
MSASVLQQLGPDLQTVSNALRKRALTKVCPLGADRVPRLHFLLERVKSSALSADYKLDRVASIGSSSAHPGIVGKRDFSSAIMYWSVIRTPE